MAPEKHRPLDAIIESWCPYVQEEAILAFRYLFSPAKKGVDAVHRAAWLWRTGSERQGITNAGPGFRLRRWPEAAAPAGRASIGNAFEGVDCVIRGSPNLARGCFDNDIRHGWLFPSCCMVHCLSGRFNTCILFLEHRRTPSG